MLPGNASLIVQPGRYTLPGMLQQAGYRTGAVGKWHLGLGGRDLDWNGEIRPGPLEVGFDYSFIFPATGDRVPCVFVENHRVVNLDPSDPIRVNYDQPFPGEPTGAANPELLKMRFSLAMASCVGDVSECLDRQRIPINAEGRKKRGGSVPYFGANGQVGWIDKPLFNEPLILVVEDETFVGRTKPFAYRIEGPSWVNNHAHILRPNANTSLKYLHYALMYYPFTPLTTGSTGRRKLTQKALMAAPLYLPNPEEQHRRVELLDRWFSIADQLSKSLSTATQRAPRLRQAILKKAFEGKLVPQDPNDEPASALLERIRAARSHAPAPRKRKVHA